MDKEGQQQLYDAIRADELRGQLHTSIRSLDAVGGHYRFFSLETAEHDADRPDLYLEALSKAGLMEVGDESAQSSRPRLRVIGVLPVGSSTRILLEDLNTMSADRS